MTNSERLFKQCEMEENDLKAMSLFFKAKREKRKEYFVDNFIPKIKEHSLVLKNIDGSYSFELSKLGKVDFFPKSNRLRVRKGNKWKNNGLKIIINYLNIKQ